MVSTILLVTGTGMFCAWLQCWMAARLEKKRWLLLLQPGLHTVIAVCFAVWVLDLEELRGSTLRYIPLLFVVLLVCTLVGWIVGNIRRRKRG